MYLMAAPSLPRQKSTTAQKHPASIAVLRARGSENAGGFLYHGNRPFFRAVTHEIRKGRGAAVECSGRGVCDYSIGACECTIGYQGPACEMSDETPTVDG